MTGLDRRKLLLGAAFGVAGLAAGAARMRPGTVLFADPARLIPRSFGPWQAITSRGVVLPPEDDLAARVYDDLIVRSYRARGKAPVSLVVAYGTRQDYAFQLHRPEICYPASGYEVVDLAKRTLSIGGVHIAGNVMLARQGANSDCVLYWTRIGDSFPQSTWQQRLAIARGIGNWPLDEGALVRFSTRSVDYAADVARLEAFATQLVGGISPDGRRLLLGTRFRNV